MRHSILRTEPTRQSLPDVWLVLVTTSCANQHPGSDCQEEKEEEEGRWCGFCDSWGPYTCGIKYTYAYLSQKRSDRNLGVNIEQGVCITNLGTWAGGVPTQ